MTTKKVHTFCRICEPACGLVAEVSDDEQILSLQPDSEHPVHQGFSCNKGVQYLHVHQDPDRLNFPLRRTNPREQDKGEFERIDWDTAIDEVATKIQALQTHYGNNTLAIYNGNPIAFNTSFYANAATLIGGFGSSLTFSPSTQDCANKFAGSEVMYGSFFVHPIPDLVHTDYFLSIGCNPAVSHMSLIHISNPMAKLKAIKARGGKVVFVNPRKIESSLPSTGETLLIKPDTDVYFLAALLHEIIFQIGYDVELLAKRGKNYDDIKDFVSQYSPDRVAAVTGIDADTIRQVAHEFCAAPSASIYMSTGVNMGRQGTLAYWLLNMISLFSGNLGKRGGNVYQTGYAKTSRHTRYVPKQEFSDTRFGELRKICGNSPGNLMGEIFDDPENPVRALLVVGGNPLLAVSGGQNLRRVFKQLELIVVLDLFRSATAEMADYVLPGLDSLEREDLYSLGPGLHLEPYVQYTPAVVLPVGERKPEWWTLSRILQSMGRPSMLDDPNPDPFKGIDQQLQESNLSIEKLKKMPCQAARLPEADPEDLFNVAIQTEDGLVDCCPDLFKRGFEAAEQQFLELSQESPDQLKLITRRTPLMINSWMNNVPDLKKGVHQRNPLWMHPKDAEGRGLFSGDLVKVSNAYGAVLAHISYDETLRSGVVSMSHGWGQNHSHGLKTARKYPGVNINELSPVGVGSFDPLSNMSQLTGLRVEVSAAE